MRAFVPDYEMITPQTLTEGLQIMKEEPGIWKPFAGGTDLMVLLEAGKLDHKRYLNMAHFKELRGVDAESSDSVIIGALTTYTDILRSSILSNEFPLLARAARETGSIATQNRGTLGGNIANASPAADSPPALLVYDAELELVSASGARWVPYQGFWKGYKQVDLRGDELIRAIRLPRNHGFSRHFYRKVGTRRAQAISKVCLAGAARIHGGRIAEVRVALGSVAPAGLRATETEKILRGEKPAPSVLLAAQQALAREIAPIDDIRSTARYRLRVAQNLLAEFCESLAS